MVRAGQPVPSPMVGVSPSFFFFVPWRTYAFPWGEVGERSEPG